MGVCYWSSSNTSGNRKCGQKSLTGASAGGDASLTFPSAPRADFWPAAAFLRATLLLPPAAAGGSESIFARRRRARARFIIRANWLPDCCSSTQPAMIQSNVHRIASMSLHPISAKVKLICSPAPLSLSLL